MENSKKNLQKPKDNANLLSAIRKLIKVDSHRQLARQILDGIDSSKLYPKNKLEYLG